ncbi:MAG: ABC transporter permease [Desulfuromonadaceae bacterium]|nr:ABC transporter permease [Desulfuromonadaceae bacterium]
MTARCKKNAGVEGWLHCETSGGETTLALSGAWTLPHFEVLSRSVQNFHGAEVQHVDFSAMTGLDTAGATLVVKLLGARDFSVVISTATGLSDERRALLLRVGQAVLDAGDALFRSRGSFGDTLEYIGRVMTGQRDNLIALLNFMGLTLVAMVSSLSRPRSWRITSLVSHMQQTGLNAVPIVALLTFLVGAVIAFLGATVLSTFGVSIYTVDLVVFAFLREFGVLLAAILLAGRTASAFTAQIGSMKVNEEIDALRVQGFDPVEMLVVPRALALLVSLPLLTFVAMVAGIAGGAMVAVFSLDISLVRFLAITQEVAVRHFWVGLVKAPVFAFVIALIGCLEGFKVEDTARSVGEHTTSSVVQSIFMVILLDAVAALFCMEMGW